MIPESAIIRECIRAASTASAKWSLPLRSRLWQGVAGEMAGFGTGSSMDFQDHRQYVPGDDPRHINWQAYARTGQYTLKLYREETRPLVEIWFDATASMFLSEAKARRSKSKPWPPAGPLPCPWPRPWRATGPVSCPPPKPANFFPLPTRSKSDPVPCA